MDVSAFLMVSPIAAAGAGVAPVTVRVRSSGVGRPGRQPGGACSLQQSGKKTFRLNFG